MDVLVPQMQHRLECGTSRIPAIDGDWLILRSILLSVLAFWTGAKRSWLSLHLLPSHCLPAQGQDMFLQLKTLGGLRAAELLLV